LFVEELDELCEISQRTGQPVDLVDDDHIDLAGFDILEEPLQGRAVQGAAGEAAVVIRAAILSPALMCLALDVGAAGLPLRIERIEVLI
jgi:hypothetical protein